jgi:hypothetical protein
MQNFKASPNDSRYIPFTQQNSCCVPTSILMIMYRHNIPLIPAEELGYNLGLIVSSEESNLFYSARVADAPPSAAGYGTQIFNPDYEPNKVFLELGIPMSFSITLADDIKDKEDLLYKLKTIELRDGDALICFNNGVIKGEYKPFSGHVAVFDKIINGKIRLVDASSVQPKWRLIEPNLLYEAIKKHGNKQSGGIWFFNLI